MQMVTYAYILSLRCVSFEEDIALPFRNMGKQASEVFSFDVYSGPGHNYHRANDGKAALSTNDWVQAYGKDGDWILVQYNVADGHNRFGYIPASAVPNHKQIQELDFLDEQYMFTANIAITDDLLRSLDDSERWPAGTIITRLASFGTAWDYVEAKYADGTPVRGFIHHAGTDIVPVE